MTSASRSDVLNITIFGISDPLVHQRWHLHAETSSRPNGDRPSTSTTPCTTPDCSYPCPSSSNTEGLTAYHSRSDAIAVGMPYPNPLRSVGSSIAVARDSFDTVHCSCGNSQTCSAHNSSPFTRPSVVRIGISQSAICNNFSPGAIHAHQYPRSRCTGSERCPQIPPAPPGTHQPNHHSSIQPSCRLSSTGSMSTRGRIGLL